MPANSRWNLIQLLKFKIVKNPGIGLLNNVNDPVLNVFKCKAIPLQAWTGPEGSRRLRLPDFKTVGT